MEDEVANEVFETFLLGEMLIGKGVEGFCFCVVGCASHCVGEEFAGQAANEGARIGEKVAFEGGDVFERSAVGESGCGVDARPLILFCVGDGVGFAPLADGVKVFE